MEKAVNMADELGSKQCCNLMDMKGVSKKNIDKQAMMTMKKLVGMFQDFYAERLAVIYVLNANAIFKFMYTIIKPFLSKKTKKKIIMLKKEGDLLLHFDAENLLQIHGGTSTFDITARNADGKPLEEDPNAVPVEEEEDLEGMELEMTEEEKKMLAEQQQEEEEEEEDDKKKKKKK